MIDDGVDVGLDDGVEISKNCGEVDRRWEILNNSCWGRAHDPVLSLSGGESVKKTQRATC